MLPSLLVTLLFPQTTITQTPTPQTPPATQLPAQIDLDLPATTLQNAAPILSKAIGKEVKIQKSAKDEVLIAFVKRVTPESLAQQIESALYVQIEQTPTEWVISRPASIVKRMEDESLRMRISDTRKLFQKVNASAKNQPVYTAAYAKKVIKRMKEAEAFFSKPPENQTPEQTDKFGKSYEEAMQTCPSSRFAAKLLSRLPESQVAQIPQGERRTFALKPTSMQFPLPTGIDALIREFSKEQEIWSNLPENQVDDENAYIRRANPFVQRQLDNVVVEVSNRADTLSLSSFILTTSKSLTFQESVYIEKGNFYPIFEGSEVENNVRDYPNFRLSPVGKRLQTYVKAEMYSIGNRDPLLNSAFGSPATIDPLSHSFSDALKAFADRQKKNLVAPGCDNALFVFQPSVWDTGLGSENFPYEKVNADGFLTLRLKNPAVLYRQNAPRDVLQTLATKLTNGKHIEIEEVGNWYRQRFPSGRASVMPMLDTLSSLLSEFSPKFAMPQMIAFFSTLTTSEKELAKKNLLNFGLLNPEAKSRLQRMMFYEAEEPFLREGQGSETEADGAEMMSDFLQAYPEIVFPQGIPNNLKLNIQDEVEPALEIGIKYDATSETNRMRLGYRELAESLFGAEMSPPDARYSIDLNQIFLAKRRQIYLNFSFRENLTWDGILTDELTSRDKVFKFKDLPPNIRKTVETELANVRKDYSTIPPEIRAQRTN